MVSAIILAAGKSTRMGEPKALLKFGKQSFLETSIANFRAADIENIIVVLGHNAEIILQNVNPSLAQFVINHNYQLGQFSSFQVGIRKLQPEAEGVFLALADQPQIGVSVIAQIVNAFYKNPERIVIPVFNGKRGHPPIFPKRLFSEILSSPPSQITSDVIRSNSELVYEVQIDDVRILRDIDTKEELLQIRKELEA
jgi:molybdenum cofactor cytidylyltransferase